MKLLLSAVLIGLVLSLSVPGQIPNSNYRILVDGCLHHEEVEAVSGNNWYGLYQSNKTYILKSVDVNLDKCYDVVLDEEGDSTGIKISAEGEPIFLIQAPNDLVEGEVATLLIETKELKPGDLVGLGGFDERHFSLAAMGDITDEGNRHPYDLAINNYRVKLYDQDAKSQTLVEFERSSFEGLPMILWAGDLDRDGTPDLILNIRNHYNIMHYALFLSSEAEPGQMVKLVAELRLTGC